MFKYHKGITFFLFSLFTVIIFGTYQINLNQTRIYNKLKQWKLAPLPETLTELYFEDHTKLPNKISPNQLYEFRFTVHNLEYQNMNYTYAVNAISNTNITQLGYGYINLKQDESKTIDEKIMFATDSGRTKIEVKLVDQDQPIHFWMDPTTPSQNGATADEAQSTTRQGITTGEDKPTPTATSSAVQNTTERLNPPSPFDKLRATAGAV